MKRRGLLIVLILFVVAILCACAYYVYYRSHIYELEYVEQEVYDAKYDSDLLIGKWQSGSLFYRFDLDSLGATWDVSDDVTEEEASLLKWELDRSKFIHYHEMQNGAFVPKQYKIKHLDLNNLVFQDDYGKEYSFVKVL